MQKLRGYENMGTDMDAFGEFIRGFQLLAIGASIVLVVDLGICLLIQYFKHRG